MKQQDNKITFLNLEPHFLSFLIFFLILFVLYVFYFLGNIEVYDNFMAKGEVTCTDTCQITTFIPSEANFEELHVFDKRVNFMIVNKEIIIDETSLTSYQKIELQTDYKGTDKEIVELTFYYNKQRIIKKLKEIIF